jgi:hypothetical protein
MKTTTYNTAKELKKAIEGLQDVTNNPEIAQATYLR